MQPACPPWNLSTTCLCSSPSSSVSAPAYSYTAKCLSPIADGPVHVEGVRRSARHSGLRQRHVHLRPRPSQCDNCRCARTCWGVQRSACPSRTPATTCLCSSPPSSVSGIPSTNVPIHVGCIQTDPFQYHERRNWYDMHKRDNWLMF